MFDIGFWELALIGTVALLVVGPERLPGLARSVGLWVGRIRRYVSHVKRDIERELHAEEVRKLLEKPEEIEGLSEVARQTASVVDETRRGLAEAAREAESDHTPSAAAASETRDAHSETAARDAAPRVPHHAVDDDPFARDSLDAVSPSSEQRGDGEAPAVRTESEAGATQASENVAQDHEQRPERSAKS